ncbi:MAG: ATP-dependent DNA helicase RecG [Firmicutes bacterium]|nr:ATP-dependent DNA helicase RecG [Bacillota bacterium]
MPVKGNSSDKYAISNSSGRHLTRLTRVGVTELKGVGPKKQQALSHLGVTNILDMITFYPRKWIDRDRPRFIAQVTEGEEVLVSGVVRGVNFRRLGKSRSLLSVKVSDSSGFLTATFFNQPWLQKKLTQGCHVEVFGKAQLYKGYLQMANPVTEVLGEKSRDHKVTGRIVPVYRMSAKADLTSNDISGFVSEALERSGEFLDPLPGEILQGLRLPSRTRAFWSIHFPKSMEEKELARSRLAFDEVLRLQVKLLERRQKAIAEAKKNKYDISTSQELVDKFLSALPFSLTEAQKKAIADIDRDLTSPYPMNRLLQGDVGSGKTIVALAAMLRGLEFGYQGVMMVPTEVLAEQHYLAAAHLTASLEKEAKDSLFATRALRAELLTGNTTGASRSKILNDLARGEIDILIGTHALLTDDVVFSALGVVVIDEQHRFGVDQREVLRSKGNGCDPDVLFMTATPIPRTVAMTAYGDLAQTIMGELPKGRLPIETVFLQGEGAEAKAYEKILEEVAKGNQAYIVCPLVEGGDLAFDGGEEDPDIKTDEDLEEEFEESLFAEKTPAAKRNRSLGVTNLNSVAELREKLSAGVFADLQVGFLHGRMSSAEKEAQINDFRAHKTQVMISTTVIEVGVDVASATVMVILNADRFGISQLHQLRGRVGRSSLQSYCYLVTSDEITEDAEKRLTALVGTQDGFSLSEVDLSIRGEGMILGTNQKGRNGFKLASLHRDYHLISLARQTAEKLMSTPTYAAEMGLLEEEICLLIPDDQAEYLSRN